MPILTVGEKFPEFNLTALTGGGALLIFAVRSATLAVI